MYVQHNLYHTRHACPRATRPSADPPARCPRATRPSADLPRAARVQRTRPALRDARANATPNRRPRQLHRSPREVAPRQCATVWISDLEWAPLWVPHRELEALEHECAAGVVVHLAICAPRARAPPTSSCQPPHETTHHNTTPTDQPTHYITCTCTLVRCTPSALLTFTHISY